MIAEAWSSSCSSTDSGPASDMEAAIASTYKECSEVYAGGAKPTGARSGGITVAVVCCVELLEFFKSEYDTVAMGTSPFTSVSDVVGGVGDSPRQGWGIRHDGLHREAHVVYPWVERYVRHPRDGDHVPPKRTLHHDISCVHIELEVRATIESQIHEDVRGVGAKVAH